MMIFLSQGFSSLGYFRVNKMICSLESTGSRFWDRVQHSGCVWGSAPRTNPWGRERNRTGQRAKLAGKWALIHSLTEPHEEPWNWNCLSVLFHHESKWLGLYTSPQWGWLPVSSSLKPKDLTARGCLPTALQKQEQSPSLKGGVYAVHLCIHQ